LLAIGPCHRRKWSPLQNPRYFGRTPTNEKQIEMKHSPGSKTTSSALMALAPRWAPQTDSDRYHAQTETKPTASDAAAGARFGAAAMMVLAAFLGNADAKVVFHGAPNDGVTFAEIYSDVILRQQLYFNEDTGQVEELFPFERFTVTDQADLTLPNLGLPDELTTVVPTKSRVYFEPYSEVNVDQSASARGDMSIGLLDDPTLGVRELTASINSRATFNSNAVSVGSVATVDVDVRSTLRFRFEVTDEPASVRSRVSFNGDLGANVLYTLNGHSNDGALVDISFVRSGFDGPSHVFDDETTLRPGNYTFRFASNVVARSNILGNQDLESELSLTFTPGPKRVVLAFGAAANAAVRETEVFGAEFSNIIVDGQATLQPFTSPNQATFNAFKESIRTQVEGVFDRASHNGVVLDNVEVVIGPPEAGATNIFFVNAEQLAVPGLEGRAYTRVDQFNEQAHGEAFVVMSPAAGFGNDYAERIAELTAHEAGHLMGLIHINPPGAGAVMDYDHVSGDQESFANGIFPLTEPPRSGGQVRSDVTHNPLYHLLRYVGGRSHEQLDAANVFPGSWDLQRASQLNVSVSANFDSPELESDLGTAGGGPGTSTTLYDLSILEADSDPSEPLLLKHFEQITLEELSLESFVIGELSGLLMFASSVAGGETDVALALGDPFREFGLVLYPGMGELSGFLQMESAAPGGYQTLAAMTLHVVSIPEPASALLIMFTAVGLAASNCRRRNIRASALSLLNVRVRHDANPLLNDRCVVSNPNFKSCQSTT
jgi:hypothetical protein